MGPYKWGLKVNGALLGALFAAYAQLTGHEVDESLGRDEPVGERWQELYGYSAGLRILGR